MSAVCSICVAAVAGEGKGRILYPEAIYSQLVAQVFTPEGIRESGRLMFGLSRLCCRQRGHAAVSVEHSTVSVGPTVQEYRIDEQQESR
jgi:hypothetical protein